MAKATPPKAKEFYFEGFPEPNTHQTPNILIDWILGHPDVVSDAELRVLLYLTRRICGFAKASDAVSYNQFLFGIRKKDGDVLDYGCGLKSRTHLGEALHSLQAKGFIEAEKRSDGRGAKVSTVYRLRFWQPPKEGTADVVPNRQQPQGGRYPRGTRGSTQPVLGVVPDGYLQSKALQSKELQYSNIRTAAQAVDNSEPAQDGQGRLTTHGSGRTTETTHVADNTLANTDSSATEQGNPKPLRVLSTRAYATKVPESSNGRSHGQNNGPELLGAILGRHSLRPEQQDAREAIQSYIKDIAQEFDDQAKLKSSVTRAYNLYEESGRTLHAFVDALFITRASVKERQESTTQEPLQNRMSYFFSVLEDQLGLKADGQAGREGESATAAGSKSPQSLGPPE
jgi:hypothetical protein